MSFDEIIDFTYNWITIFGGFLDMLMLPLKDIVGPLGWVLPDRFANLTLFGLMFGAGFVFACAIILIKWFLDIIN